MKTKSKSRTKQLSMIPEMDDVFMGLRRGTHSKGHRPLDSKKPLHVCFRSKFATGKRTMLGLNKIKVNRLVQEISRRFNIKIVKYANVGNHLHLVVKLPGSAMIARMQYSKWIRLVTSRIAFEVGGSRKGRPFKNEAGEVKKFWDSIPFSRVVHGLRGFRILSRYVLKNELESRGLSKERAIRLASELYESGRILGLPDENTG